MKSSIAVTLIICGTFLITVPYIHNDLVTHLVSQSATQLKKDINVRISAPMPEYADTACILGGITMILIGAAAGIKQTLQPQNLNENHPQNPESTNA
ncbi:hypothetical protein STSP2_00804 [Anaerohalosphaera lusitana]|uniref:Uncharacterized protein n=1 Tax=Anaerohalosphaera lusitana TaxID=1936003 RepID=A0A1U9NJG3_9BACT|nr:hypothetical protein [Anaerohalosphaera lusitana]AQT67656.1 hypothetical protein STSP2_00804 [Anaerohalosphaera lusitana]